MGLVERYIEAVKFWLPKHLKDDVGAELKDDICAEIEEAERQKGRPLNEDEVAAILKARGKPILVASRYLPRRTLIGPELYPLYIFVLKIVAAISLIPPVLVAIVYLAGDRSGPVPDIVASPFNALLTSFAIVTLIFAVLERKGVNPAKNDNWNPKSLPVPATKNRIRRSETVFEIIGNLVVIGFFLAGYLSQTTYQLIHGTSAMQVTITVCPQWIAYWQIIVVIALAEIALASANLFKPYWSASRASARMGVDLAKTAAICWLLQNHLVRAIETYGAGALPASMLKDLSDRLAGYATELALLLSAIIVITALVRLVRLARTPA